ncbi:MAG: PQQ-binding-like beta-propeller repeat protein [Planctomycetota bacterium]
MLLGSLLLAGPLSGGDDWTQWRGKNRADISTETGLLQEWPEGGPKVLWTNKEGGLGYAGFAVVGDRLYTMGLDGSEEFTLCLDANTGAQIWKTTIGSQFENGWGDGPRSTPTVDGEHIYCMPAQGALTCLTLDGKIKWTRKMDEFGGKVPFWGYSESPLVEGDLVCCTPGGDQGAIVGLNKATGELVWQTKDLTPQAHYSSLIAAEINGQRQLVQQLLDSIVGIDPKTGEVLWKQDWSGATAVIPTPVSLGNNRIYITTGYGVGCTALEIEPGNKVKELWKNRVMKNHHGGVIFLNGYLYGYSDGPCFTCQDPTTGEALWTEKKIKKGALSYADGRFYFLQEGDGKVLLFAAKEKEWTPTGSFVFEPQSEKRNPRGAIWVHPVIANGKLFLRDQEIINCYDIKAK